MTAESPMLPGMGPESPGPSRIEAAAERQIAFLESQGRLTEDHAIVVELIRDLARAVGSSSVQRRGSALAMTAKELREALALLPAPTKATDGWTELERTLQSAVAGPPQ